MGIYLKVKVSLGTEILESIQQAIKIAEQLGIDVVYEFSGERLRARPDSSESEMYQDYIRKISDK